MVIANVTFCAESDSDSSRKIINRRFSNVHPKYK